MATKKYIFDIELRLAKEAERPMRWSKCRFLGLGMWLQILIFMSLFFSFIPPIIYGAGQAELIPLETAEKIGREAIIAGDETGGPVSLIMSIGKMTF